MVWATSVWHRSCRSGTRMGHISWRGLHPRSRLGCHVELPPTSYWRFSSAKCFNYRFFHIWSDNGGERNENSELKGLDAESQPLSLDDCLLLPYLKHLLRSWVGSYWQFINVLNYPDLWDGQELFTCQKLRKICWDWKYVWIQVII